MLLQIDHHSGVPIYRQVVDQTRRQILAGQLKGGEQLVSVRDLAGELVVNPMTISKAYALLEMEGLVERRRGIGLFVASVEKKHESKTKARLLRGSLEKAVLAAVQFGIPEEKVVRIVEELYQKYDSQTRSQSDE